MAQPHRKTNADQPPQSGWVSRVASAVDASKKPKQKLRVATYNIMNVNTGTGDPDPSNNDRLDRLAQSIIRDLESPDIIALQEVQDNNGPAETNPSRTSATKNLQELVDAIAAQGGPRYQFAQIDPEYQKDGGEPSANIRQAFLYNAEILGLHPARDGKGNFAQEATILTDDTGVHLSRNPGRIDPNNRCFEHSRKPLVAEFVDNRTGRSLFVVNVHLNSKRGEDEKSTQKRNEQAQVIDRFITELDDKLEAAGQDKAYMVMGDYNSEPNEEPVRIIAKGPDRKNLAKGLEDGTYYTYIYDGKKQAIDHIIASIDLRNTGAKAVLINADKPYKTRTSDHNPVKADIWLKRKPNPDGQEASGPSR